MSDWSLAQPLWLIVTAFGVLGLWVLTRGAKLPAQGRLHRWMGAPVTVRQRCARWLWPGQLLAMLMLGLGLAGPFQQQMTAPDAAPGLDVTLLLDRSSSMDREDPVTGRTRLQDARQVLDEFITARRGDRFALFTFARDPELLCPATIDHELLRQWVQEVEALDPGSDRDRTALGVALARVATVSRPVDRGAPLLILLTDGENNVNTIAPAEGAMLCRRAGLRLYAIGITGPGGANPMALSKLAESTGGRGFGVTDARELRAAYDEIARIEMARIEAAPRSLVHDRSRWVLVPGALLFVGLFLMERCFLSRVN